MHKVKFGLFLPTGDFARARRVAQRAETDGFYSVSLNDHFYSPMGWRDPQLECFTALTAIVALTSRLRVAPSVAAMSFRHPALLAKIAATLDHVSNGRLTLGLGSGWQREEYDAHGFPYPSNAERLEQLAEGIGVLKAMWTQAEPRFQGRYFSINQGGSLPRPLQKPHPPLMLGGSGKKLIEVAARHADIALLSPPIYHGRDAVQDPSSSVKFTKTVAKKRIDLLRTLAQAAERKPDDIELGALVFVKMADSQSQADALAESTAAQIGFASAQAARNAPGLLLGTPEEVKRELQSRIDELGMTYFIAALYGQPSYELFVRQVMPQFAG